MAQYDFFCWFRYHSGIHVSIRSCYSTYSPLDYKDVPMMSLRGYQDIPLTVLHKICDISRDEMCLWIAVIASHDSLLDRL